MNANHIIEILFSLLGTKAAGNTSDEVKNDAIDLLDSLFKNKSIKKSYYNPIYKKSIRINFSNKCF